MYIMLVKPVRSIDMCPRHKLQLFLLLGSVFQNALGVINGWEVSDYSMQYMASLQSNGKHECGGFLISEDFVLTAAMCETVNSVVLGTHHLSSASNDMRYCVKKCKHPSYETVAKGNNIMLLKLSRKAQGSMIQTVALGPVSGTSCQVAGWGYASSQSFNRETVNDLRQVSVQIVQERECEWKWGRHFPHSIICAGGMGTNKGFCQGDAGGPLLCNNLAVGIVSFNRARDCDYSKNNRNNDFPNVYTDISTFLPWISNVLAKGDC